VQLFLPNSSPSLDEQNAREARVSINHTDVCLRTLCGNVRRIDHRALLQREIPPPEEEEEGGRKKREKKRESVASSAGDAGKYVESTETRGRKKRELKERGEIGVIRDESRYELADRMAGDGSPPELILAISILHPFA